MAVSAGLWAFSWACPSLLSLLSSPSSELSSGLSGNYSFSTSYSLVDLCSLFGKVLSRVCSVRFNSNGTCQKIKYR